MNDTTEYSPLKQKRPVCTRCNRPLRTCLCDLITPASSSIKLTVLQHPKERYHPKNTLQLLQLCLPQLELASGERFNCQDVMNDPTRETLLVYPGENAELISSAAQRIEASKIQLIFIDGTWRKSRKILHLNPFLQNLPRISFPNDLISQYNIRKAHQQSQLSTFEAINHAVMAIEHSDTQFKALEQAFSNFVQRYAQFTPRRPE